MINKSVWFSRITLMTAIRGTGDVICQTSRGTITRLNGKVNMEGKEHTLFYVYVQIIVRHILGEIQRKA